MRSRTMELQNDVKNKGGKDKMRSRKKRKRKNVEETFLRTRVRKQR